MKESPRTLIKLILAFINRCYGVYSNIWVRCRLPFMFCRLWSLVSAWPSGSSRSPQSFPKISGRLKRLLVSKWSALKTRGRKRCSWVRQQSFGAIPGNEMTDINRRASLLACYHQSGSFLPLWRFLKSACFESSEAYVASIFVDFRSKEISRKAIFDVFALRIAIFALVALFVRPNHWESLSVRPSSRESFSSISLCSENNYVAYIKCNHWHLSL